MTTKNILITGSTDGIGKLAAIQLAQAGHHIYLHGRSKSKLQKVVEEIKSTTQNGQIKGFVADFSVLQAVTEMAEQVQAEMPKLDILINNAGVFKSPVVHNADGLDLRFVVNYLAPFMLTQRLISLLTKGEDARIINLSSAAQAAVSHDALIGKKDESAQQTYAQSKLALTMWTFHLAQKLDDIAAVAVNPGSLLNTNMVKEAYGRFWASAEKGADILRKLAVEMKSEELHGKYFDNDAGAFGHAHPDAYDSPKIKELIQTTESLLQRLASS